MPDSLDPAKDTPLLTRRTIGIAFLLMAVSLILLVVWLGTSRSDVVWIHNDTESIWIKPDVTPDLALLYPQENTVDYHANFEIETVPSTVPLTIEVVDEVAVFVNDNLIHNHSSSAETINTVQLDMATHLRPGANLITFSLRNDSSPPLLRVSSPSIGLGTHDSDQQWSFTSDEVDEGPVIDATKALRANTPPSSMATPAKGLRVLPYFLVLFFVLYLTLQRWNRMNAIRDSFSPAKIRFLIMALYLVLAVNNLKRIPDYVGMDVQDHYAYLTLMITEYRLPLAPDGIFGFRHPLMYLIAAPLFAVAQFLFEDHTARQLVRVFPYLMGLAQIEIHYRLFKLVTPKHPRLIILGTLIGAFFPINLYMSNFFSDEPAAGFMGACVVLYAIMLLHQKTTPSARQAAVAGGLIGLALLAKTSTGILVLPCLIAMIVCHRPRDGQASWNLPPLIRNIGFSTATFALVCGWYFLRNWYYLDTPLVLGWNNDSYTFWQYPGYRTSAQYLHFGLALVNPIDSAVYSFWDGFYSTVWLDGWAQPGKNWNPALLMMSAWLALIPTALLSVGLVQPLVNLIRDPNTRCTTADLVYLFTTTCIGLYVLAIVYMHLTTSMYSTLKGSYLYAVLPCLTYTIVRAIEWIENRSGPRMQTVLYATLACWMASVYGSFFVIH